MKTIFEKILFHFECISHPAGGWFSKNNPTQRKRKASGLTGQPVQSPECFNIRGVSSKKASFRRTPAP
jgi:hypothetical protein